MKQVTSFVSGPCIGRAGTRQLDHEEPHGFSAHCGARVVIHRNPQEMKLNPLTIAIHQIEQRVEKLATGNGIPLAG